MRNQLVDHYGPCTDRFVSVESVVVVWLVHNKVIKPICCNLAANICIPCILIVNPYT